MKFKDQRFAKDPRFRFFAMNSNLRWQAINQGDVFVKNNNAFRSANALEMREMLRQNHLLAKEIMFYGSSLRGTRPFWFKRCGELLDTVHQLKTPVAFATLSAADYHWPDLYRLADTESLREGMYDAVADRYRQKIMHENPLVVATFFTKG